MNITGTPQAVSALALRQRAEANLQKKANLSPEELRALSPETTQAMLHEMQVHQIELELQNEELRRAQLALKDSQARYFDLYDQAPVGYARSAGSPWRSTREKGSRTGGWATPAACARCS
jgi:hypothetical protein